MFLTFEQALFLLNDTGDRMTKVIELEGRTVTIRFKNIEINGLNITVPGQIEVSDTWPVQQEAIKSAMTEISGQDNGQDSSQR